VFKSLETAVFLLRSSLYICNIMFMVRTL